MVKKEKHTSMLFQHSQQEPLDQAELKITHLWTSSDEDGHYLTVNAVALLVSSGLRRQVERFV